jgi:hypothetical protein
LGVYGSHVRVLSDYLVEIIVRLVEQEASEVTAVIIQLGHDDGLE